MQLSKTQKKRVTLILICIIPFYQTTLLYYNYSQNNNYSYEFNLKCNLNQANYTILSSKYGQLLKVCLTHKIEFNKEGNVKMILNITSEYNPKLLNNFEFLMFRTHPHWYSTNYSIISSSYGSYYDNASQTLIKNNQKYNLVSDWFNLTEHFDSSAKYNASFLEAYFRFSFIGNDSEQSQFGPTSIDWTLFNYDFHENDYNNQNYTSYTSNNSVQTWNDINFKINKSFIEFYGIYQTVILANLLTLLFGGLGVEVGYLETKEEIEHRKKFERVSGNMEKLKNENKILKKDVDILKRQFEDLKEMLDSSK